ncbi:TIGR03086 family metal-binding protein [Micromonospora sp. NPDC003197]
MSHASAQPDADPEQDPRRLHHRAGALADRLISAISPDQFTHPTPCPDWDVGGLLNHVVNGNHRFIAIVTSQPVPDRDTVLLGTDHVAAFRSSLARLTEIFADDDTLAAEHATPIGTEPGTHLLQTRVIELLVHGWDLARATKQATDFDADLCRSCLDILRGRSLPRGTDAPFALIHPVPADVSAADQLAAFAGRDPGWAPGPATGDPAAAQSGQTAAAQYGRTATRPEEDAQ